MGIHVRQQEIEDFVRDQNLFLEKKILALEAFVRAYRVFTDAGGLRGLGWDSAKSLIRDAYLPLAKIQVRHSEALMTANSKLSVYLDADLDGDELLDEDGLERTLADLRQQRAEIERMEALRAAASIPEGVFGLPAYNRLLADNEQDIRQVEHKLDQLRRFDQHTKNLYDEAESYGRQAERALASVRGKGWDAASGRFSAAGIDMGWADGVADYWRAREESSDAVAFYMNTVGMDRVQANVLAGFDRRFAEYAKAQGWTAEQAQYEYCRIVASVSYHGLNWYMAAGTSNELNLRSILDGMGIAGSDNDLFVFALQQQSGGYDSSGRIKLAVHRVDFVHLMGSVAAIVQQDRQPWSAGSVATKLGTAVGFEQYYREAATFAGDIASGSMPAADIPTDLDAVNLSDRLRRDKSTAVADLVADYYRGVADGGVDRREEFFRHYAARYGKRDDPGSGLRALEQRLDEMLTSPGVMVIGKGAVAAEEEDSIKKGEPEGVGRERLWARQRQARQGFLEYLRAGGGDR